MTEYLKMEAPEMLTALGDDAQKWAEAFVERFPGLCVADVFGWFANAIENSSDVRFFRLVKSDEAWSDFRQRVEEMRDITGRVSGGEAPVETWEAAEARSEALRSALGYYAAQGPGSGTPEEVVKTARTFAEFLIHDGLTITSTPAL